MIPQVDWLLNQAEVRKLAEKFPRDLIAWQVRKISEQIRGEILAGENSFFDEKTVNKNVLKEEIFSRLKMSVQPNLKRVINAGGIILNTGLGRAPLSKAAREALAIVSGGFSSVEIDLPSGKRGNRHNLVEEYLTELTGAEAAAVVNNNAAATLLTLNTLAQNRQVIVSRGELVTIGGSFRIPEVMKRSGAVMREVGTTNHTKVGDYESAINEETGLLLKVHTSNYKIIGFTSETSLEELVVLGEKNHLPVMHDLGSGMLFDLSEFGLPKEPVVSESVNAGADVVTFSGDKLLGGPQAGIIVGKKRFIEAIKENQLARALRCGKLTFAALEATLRLYFDKDLLLQEHPALKFMLRTESQLQRMASRLRQGLRNVIQERGDVQIQKGRSEVGGGSLATESLPTRLVLVSVKNFSAETLAKELRLGEPAIVTRIINDRVAFDVRTLFEPEIRMIVASVQKIISAENE
ncbi:MAG: L-seryl-tRNA(Sec) selenium transferase [Calditrichaeota bacterium]|nr:L-seryl-tRNA(Sec) selenium transferase [Calditrichota bacterium]